MTGTGILEPYTSGCSEASRSRTWRPSRYVGFWRAPLLGRSQEVHGQQSKFGSAHISREPPTAGALAGPGRGLRERCMLLNWQTWTWEESVEVIGAV